MRAIFVVLSLLALASCGPRVSGAMANACMDAGRSAANAALCNCIQRVANQSLSGSDERKIVPFFDDPERAQAVKASDTRSNDAFWDRYQVFYRQARSSCR